MESRDVTLEERIRNDFTYHPPTGDAVYNMQNLRRFARDLALLMERSVPPGRELSLALTHMEQAVMWANAGVARKEPEA